ncbi:MAG TPA: YtxH domain-containing protein [Peptostreptococcaceae bacterium]|nr:YtxH domain-containing protein [Peptostreptococcaceae bacterium]
MSKKKGKYLLLGAFLGFIAGLFLAPKKGSELRREAKDKIEKVKENPKEVLQETFDGVKEKINNMVDDNFIDEDINICEDEIVISKSFDEEGDNN